MRQLLQFTLDLFDTEPAPPRSSLGPTRTPDFEKNKLLPSVDRSSVAIEKIVDDGLPEAAVDRALAPERFAHPRANRAIALAGTLVSYEFRRGKRRTIGFSIGPDGLSVRAPPSRAP